MATARARASSRIRSARMLAHGHELALHGYTHLDDAPGARRRCGSAACATCTPSARANLPPSTRTKRAGASPGPGLVPRARLAGERLRGAGLAARAGAPGQALRDVSASSTPPPSRAFTCCEQKRERVLAEPGVRRAQQGRHGRCRRAGRLAPLRTCCRAQRRWCAWRLHPRDAPLSRAGAPCPAPGRAAARVAHAADQGRRSPSAYQYGPQPPPMRQCERPKPA